MSIYIDGFSKLTRDEKIKRLVYELQLSEDTGLFLNQFRNQDLTVQKLLEELSENTVTNFPLPYGIAPNFLINGKVYHVPMVTEESSVVAAAAKAAKTWYKHGGFRATVHATTKMGHVHFIWSGNTAKLKHVFPALELALRKKVTALTQSMEQRGGGIKKIEMINKTSDLPHYFQLAVSFDTVDAMGANFINSCLEAMAAELSLFFQESPDFTGKERKVDVVMSILSNYNPECLVKVSVACPVRKLDAYLGLTAEEYARKFKLAVDISRKDVYRAVTHNKGIFNGIDAVAIATGNDTRAIAAGAHAFAARGGYYRGLSTVDLVDDNFIFSLKLPLTVGTVGGITTVHPLTKLSLQILGQPNAKELMMVMASVGLASNFAAVNALITSGIQKGHMKMHLSNILNQLQATETQKELALHHFKDKTVSFSQVERFLKLKEHSEKHSIED